METIRIILRPWRDSDADILYKWASDPDIGPRAGWAPHKSVEESLEVIRTVFKDTANSWAIELKETGKAIGAITIEVWHQACGCKCLNDLREVQPVKATMEKRICLGKNVTLVR